MTERLFTQPETALMLGYKHYRSVNRLVLSGELECVKRKGRKNFIKILQFCKKSFEIIKMKNSSVLKIFKKQDIYITK